MKVEVRTFLTMKEATGGRSSLELSSTVGERFGEDFVNRVFELGEEVHSRQVLVLVNGKNTSSLSEGLDTPLEEGDEIAIFPPIVGGI
jgi:molybdopterin synthase sulfur carrier subunit